MQMQVDVAKLVLDFLQLDAPRLPAAAVIRYLSAAIGLAGGDDALLRLTLEGARSALRTELIDDDQREALTQLAADAVSAMQERGLVRQLSTLGASPLQSPPD
jgi:hypothetical protein